MKITIEVSDQSVIELLEAFLTQPKKDDTETTSVKPVQTQDLRTSFKRLAKEKKLTYADMAQRAGIEESTIKCYMCGANDSRRVAEKLADVLGMSILYNNGEFVAVTERSD